MDERLPQHAGVIGRSHYEVFPDLPDRWREHHDRCLAGESLHSEEELYLRADGRRDWIRWQCVPWRESTGTVGGIILHTEFVTERVEAEHALRQMHHNLERLVADRTEQLRKAKEESERANTAKSSFLAAASHDLRQPLQAANAYLAALEAKLNASDLSALADKLRHSIDVMGDVLNTLLDVSML